MRALLDVVVFVFVVVVVVVVVVVAYRIKNSARFSFVIFSKQGPML